MNKLFGVNHEVQAYANRVAQLVGRDLGPWGSRISQCLEQIYTGIGSLVTSPATLIDAIFLMDGANLGVGTSFLSLRGRVGTWVGTPLQAADGMSFDGATQYGTMTVPDTRGGTIAVVCRRTSLFVGGSANDSPCAITNSGGVDTAGGLTFRQAAGRYLTSQVRQGATNTSVNNPSGTITQMEAGQHVPYQQRVITTNDNAASPTGNIYVGGSLAATGFQGAVAQVTSSCTLLTIGGIWQGGAISTPWPGVVTAVLFFNRALTAAECAIVDRALYWLSHVDTLLAIEGDSTQWVDLGADGSVWSVQGFKDGTFPYCTVNWAYTGDRVSAMATTFASQVAPLGNLQRFRNKVLVLQGGFNDIITDLATAATAYANYKSCLTQARAAGFTRLVAMTLYLNTSSSAATDLVIQQFNALMRADTAYDALVEQDVLFPTKAANPLHLLTGPNTILKTAVKAAIGTLT